MGEGSRSIGEVLSVLQADFPDITVSKIRFLESQGLVSPDRNQAGYRIFSDADVERLRWILTQQKVHFLPLKVIKQKLDRSPRDFEAMAHGEDPGPSAVGRAAPRGGRRLAEAAETGLSLNSEELARGSGLGEGEIRELTRMGVLSATELAGTLVYDENALRIAQLASRFKAHGIEPRHLRMYKIATEREAGLYEQLLLPLLKQRQGDRRDRALDLLEGLVGLAEELRLALLRQALRPHLGA